MRELKAITIVEDRTTASRCDRGFLTLERLLLRNEYADGSSSADYPCDLVSRQGIDAVVAVLYEIEGEQRVNVLLRESPRAPVYLRHRKTFVHPDKGSYLTLMELVAGIVEPEHDEPGDKGKCHRAAVEAHEEAGVELPDEAFEVLGDETFASPGTGDEKLFFCGAAASLDGAHQGAGDGSTMEEFGRIHVMELGDAITACRTGAIPDMKTEVGLLRLADYLGYLPQLGCFAATLPPELAARANSLGVQSSSGDVQ
ncbi:MAG: NUDIX hydrolase [Planctomycetota bacterium]|nr:NUDIX hydrolase [Planctomycetota bacterium]